MAGNVLFQQAQQRNLDKLDKLVYKSKSVILAIKSVWPFDFFPDEIVMDETKVSIIHRVFFFSNQIRSIEYKDILNVIVEHSIFFASLQIIDRYFQELPVVTRYLKKDEAILAKRVIQGMIIVIKEGIDVHALSIGELLVRVEKVGKSR